MGDCGTCASMYTSLSPESCPSLSESEFEMAISASELPLSDTHDAKLGIFIGVFLGIFELEIILRITKLGIFRNARGGGVTGGGGERGGGGGGGGGARGGGFFGFFVIVFGTFLGLLLLTLRTGVLSNLVGIQLLDSEIIFSASVCSQWSYFLK